MSKLSEETRQSIYRLRKEGNTHKAIAHMLGIPAYLVFYNLKAKEKGFASAEEYIQDRKRRLLARFNPEGSGWWFCAPQESSAESFAAPLAAYCDYYKCLAETNTSPHTMPFRKYEQYKKWREAAPKIQEGGNFIINRLNELEKNRSWLAKQIGHSRTLIYFYTNGICRPPKKTLEKIALALDVPLQKLEGLYCCQRPAYKPAWSKKDRYRRRLAMVNPATGLLFSPPIESSADSFAASLDDYCGYYGFLAGMKTTPRFAPFSRYQKVMKAQQEAVKVCGFWEFVERMLKMIKKDQSWLAEQAGYTRSAVSHCIRNNIRPRKKMLGNISSALGVPLETLEELLGHNSCQ